MIVNDRKELDEQLDFWQRAFEKAVGVPAPDEMGTISTLNRMGAMTMKLDPYSRQWVEGAASGKGEVIDIGCAYGVATLEALKRGGRVFATDKHLAHLKALRKLVPQEQLSRLRTRAASFPYKLKVRPNSKRAVLCSRLFHFFDGQTIVDAVDAIWKMLEPGGIVYVVADSPYLGTLKDFITEYQTALLSGYDWPGWCDRMHELEPDKKEFIPNEMHFLCPQVLSRVFGNRGFLLREARFFARGDHDGFPEFLRLDGREGVAYVGQKPVVGTSDDEPAASKLSVVGSFDPLSSSV